MVIIQRLRAKPWGVFVLAAVAALFFVRMKVRVDPDLFFHLKEGGRVLSEGRLPLIEEYSYTRAGKSMVATEWLSGAVFAALFRMGGYGTVAAFNAVLIVAALWLMGKIWGKDIPEPLRALICALTAFAFLNFALTKVQNFTFLFFALFLYWVRLWESGRRWVPWAMTAVLIPWVNLHGGFFLGWIMLGALCGLDFLENRDLRALAPWAAGTFACFIHPNGVTAFVYPLWFFFAAPAGRSLILEWRPLQIAWSACPYALVLAAFFAARAHRMRSHFPWAAFALLFLALGLRTRKMLPFFALTTGAVTGLSWAKEKLSGAAASLCLAGSLSILIAIAAVESGEARALASLGPVSDFERGYPRVAAEKVAELYPGRRLFHPYDWGGYLVYKIAPRVPVFIDGRLDPYWTLTGDYQRLISAAPGWENLADVHGIEIALFSPSCALAKAMDLNPGWKPIGADKISVLFARRELKPK